MTRQTRDALLTALLIAAVIILTLAAPADANGPAVVYGEDAVAAECDVPPGIQAVGCYDSATQTVYVAEPGDEDTLEHERAHAFDHDHLTDAHRAFFTRLLGFRKGRPWFAKVAGRVSPGERFADAFSLCVRGVRVRPGQMLDTSYGYVPAPRRHQRICNAIFVLRALAR